jgi:hypothetical protein
MLRREAAGISPLDRYHQIGCKADTMDYLAAIILMLVGVIGLKLVPAN